YDILESAIETARRVNVGKACRSFMSDKSQIPVCDYTVASGPFNFRAEHSHEAWTELILNELNFINRVSRKGFASNFLTKYSDPEKVRPHLYYADPLFLFDYCKRNFSRNVALLHDYDLYDFTIIVRKE
ncbi:MAG: class I SAM-dependent methyltransferase, partial [Chloroflexi bacterium]|nr:class I SAM-dependent methyltransferase [Chloroflexota bacterium]